MILEKLFKRAERAYLTKRIKAECPSLAKHSGDALIKAYQHHAVQRFVEAEQAYKAALAIDSATTMLPPTLPSLLQRAIAYDATKSKGYYRVQAMLSEAQLCIALGEKVMAELQATEQLQRNNELAYENIELRKLVKQAADTLEGLKYPTANVN